MRQVRLHPLCKISRRLRVHRDKRRPRMRAQMIHADDRHAQRECQGLGRRPADRQTRRQPRPMRHRDFRDRRKLRLRPRQRDQRRELAQMLPRRHIWHDATMRLVQRDLTVHPLARQTARGIKQRHRRFITGTFKRKNHVRLKKINACPRPHSARSAPPARARLATHRAPPAIADPRWA